jgi:hypothetical protein
MRRLWQGVNGIEGEDFRARRFPVTERKRRESGGEERADVRVPSVGEREGGGRGAGLVRAAAGLLPGWAPGAAQ